MSDVLVDDRLLGALLRHERVRGLRSRAKFHTTGYWYFRLCSAYFASDAAGVLSRPFRGLPEDRRAQAEAQLLELPDSIGLLSLRTLAPTMGNLRRSHPTLNVLALEALAAAATLEADVFASAHSPQLEAALSKEGRRYTILVSQ